MRLLVVAVGRVKQGGMRAELDEYFGRVRRYAPCDEVELRDGKPADLAARFARALPERARVVALEPAGQAMTSEQLAAFVGRSQQDAVGTLAFLIGGADGLPASVSALSQRRLSLSALTLPHRLARLVLAEQLYRAFTILRGEPYNH